MRLYNDGRVHEQDLSAVYTSALDCSYKYTLYMHVILCYLLLSPKHIIFYNHVPYHDYVDVNSMS